MQREELITKLAAREKNAGLPAVLLSTAAGSLLGGIGSKAFGNNDLDTEEGRSAAQKSELLSRGTGAVGGLLAALALGLHKRRGILRQVGRSLW